MLRTIYFPADCLARVALDADARKQRDLEAKEIAQLEHDEYLYKEDFKGLSAQVKATSLLRLHQMRKQFCDCCFSSSLSSTCWLAHTEIATLVYKFFWSILFSSDVSMV
jgi:hypothetical protein